MKISHLIISLAITSNLIAESTLGIRGGVESGIHLQNSFSTQLLSTLFTSLSYKKKLSKGQLDLKFRLSPRYYHPEKFSNFRMVSNADFRKNLGSNLLNLSLILRKNWYDRNEPGTSTQLMPAI